MEDLKFTLDAVRKIERDLGGDSIYIIITKVSITNLITIIKRGLGVSEDEAMHKIEKFLEDSDINSLYELVGKKLQEAGFLDRKASLK